MHERGNDFCSIKKESVFVLYTRKRRQKETRVERRQVRKISPTKVPKHQARSRAGTESTAPKLVGAENVAKDGKDGLLPFALISIEAAIPCTDRNCQRHRSASSGRIRVCRCKTMRLRRNCQGWSMYITSRCHSGKRRRCRHEGLQWHWRWRWRHRICIWDVHKVICGRGVVEG
jgi:hypothetical protein